MHARLCAGAGVCARTCGCGRVHGGACERVRFPRGRAGSSVYVSVCVGMSMPLEAVADGIRSRGMCHWLIVAAAG